MWPLIALVVGFAIGWIAHDFWTWLIRRAESDE